MSSERLREAARVLRERAEAATEGPWSVVPGASNVWHFPDEGTPTLVVGGTGAARVHRRATEARLSDAAYIATMHPGVGLALADWLETVGAWIDEGLGLIPPDINIGDAWADVEGQAHKVADLILGDAP